MWYDDGMTVATLPSNDGGIPRRFVVYDAEWNVAAEAVQFTDGRVVLRWTADDTVETVTSVPAVRAMSASYTVYWLDY